MLWGGKLNGMTGINEALEERKKVWEHCGMMDDMEYAERAVQKIAEYEKMIIFREII